MKRTKELKEQEVRNDLWQSLKGAIDKHKIEHLEWHQNGTQKTITIEIDTDAKG